MFAGTSDFFERNFSAKDIASLRLMGAAMTHAVKMVAKVDERSVRFISKDVRKNEGGFLIPAPLCDIMWDILAYQIISLLSSQIRNCPCHKRQPRKHQESRQETFPMKNHLRQQMLKRPYWPTCRKLQLPRLKRGERSLQ